MNPLEIVRTTRLDGGLSIEERVRAMRAFARLEARMAQLELIAQRARELPPAAGIGNPRLADGVLLLELALTDLDHHPDTRPTPTEASPEATARERWPAWRDQRSPGEHDI